MKKGQSRRVWTQEQKVESVYKHLNNDISVRTLEKEHHADRTITIGHDVANALRDAKAIYDNNGELSILIL